MPTNVPRNEDGFEDMDAFFKSPGDGPSKPTRTPKNRRNGGGPSSSPNDRPAPRRRGRLSDLHNDDEADSLVADDLLVDEDDVGNTTPPAPFFQSSPSE